MNIYLSKFSEKIYFLINESNKKNSVCKIFMKKNIFSKIKLEDKFENNFTFYDENVLFDLIIFDNFNSKDIQILNNANYNCKCYIFGSSLTKTNFDFYKFIHQKRVEVIFINKKFENIAFEKLL